MFLLMVFVIARSASQTNTCAPTWGSGTHTRHSSSYFFKFWCRTCSRGALWVDRIRSWHLHLTGITSDRVNTAEDGGIGERGENNQWKRFPPVLPYPLPSLFPSFNPVAEVLKLKRKKCNLKTWGKQSQNTCFWRRHNFLVPCPISYGPEGCRMRFNTWFYTAD